MIHIGNAIDFSACLFYGPCTLKASEKLADMSTE